MQWRRLILIYFYLCPIERIVTQKSRANRAAVTKAATTTKKTTLTQPSGNTCLRRGSSDGCRASRRQAYKDSPRPRSRSAREESEFEHRSLLVSLYLSSWPHRSHFRIFGKVYLTYVVHEYPLSDVCIDGEVSKSPIFCRPKLSKNTECNNEDVRVRFPRSHPLPVLTKEF